MKSRETFMNDDNHFGSHFIERLSDVIIHNNSLFYKVILYIYKSSIKQTKEDSFLSYTKRLIRKYNSKSYKYNTYYKLHNLLN